MKVQCTNCQTKLNLPDDKLDPGSDFSFKCPKCGQKNIVTVPLTSEAPLPAPLGPESEDDEPGTTGEFFEEGAKPALICFDEGPLRNKLAGIARDLEYVPVFPSGVRDAIKRIRIIPYRMILLHENYAGQTLQNNSIYATLKYMEMPIRRRVFFALFGKGLTTMDQMTSFAMSANAIINLADEAQFGKILKRAISEYEAFYRVFFDVMREMGKI